MGGLAQKTIFPSEFKGLTMPKSGFFHFFDKTTSLGYNGSDLGLKVVEEDYESLR